MAETTAARTSGDAGIRPRRKLRLVGYLILVVFAFVSLMMAGIARHGTTTSELLHGPDDFMRMVRVDVLLEGQGWTDTVERRIDPPEGVRLHWSRLTDLPLAAGILALEPLMGEAAARRLALIVVPAGLGALFAAAFVWAAVPLARDRPLMVPMLMIGTVTVPLTQLLPGRIDHHGMQLLFAALGAGLLFRALLNAEIKWPAWLGGIGGIALATGLEALPWLGGATVALALDWVWRGREGARALLVFGGTMLAVTIVLIPATLPPDLWGKAACDQLSVAQIALVAIVPFVGAGAMAFERLGPTPGPWRRFGLAGVMGLAGLAAVTAAFPQCVTGPYGELSPGLRFWLESVSEAQPLWHYAAVKPGGAATFIVLPVAALAFAVWRLAATDGETRPFRVAPLILIVVGLALVTWQIRGATYAALFAGLALVPLAAAFDARADRSRILPARLALRLCVPMLATLAVFSPYTLLERPADRARAAIAKCDLGPALEALSDPARLGVRPLTLAAPIFEGPEILYYTPHRVLAAPYHRNARGIQDNRRIFAGRESEALVTIRRRGVGAVLFCRDHGPPQRFADRRPFLTERLSKDRPPPWLVPVVVTDELGLYRVRDTGGANP